jgi:prevent-host-death family protein
MGKPKDQAMQLTIAEAKSRFAEILAAAERGEEVVIARRGGVVRLVPIFAPRPIRLGLLKGVVSKNSIPDFCSPDGKETEAG